MTSDNDNLTLDEFKAGVEPHGTAPLPFQIGSLRAFIFQPVKGSGFALIDQRGAQLFLSAAQPHPACPPHVGGVPRMSGIPPKKVIPPRPSYLRVV